MRFETIRFVVSFRQVSLLRCWCCCCCFVHLILKCLQFSVWNSRRVKGQQRLRSCPLQLINEHIYKTLTHTTHTYNNNFKYACALLDQIQFSEAVAKGEGEMRGGERETVGEGARGFNCRTCLLRLAFFVQHTKRGTHLSIFHREREGERHVRGRLRTGSIVCRTQLHFILRALRSNSARTETLPYYCCSCCRIVVAAAAVIVVVILSCCCCFS